MFKAEELKLVFSGEDYFTRALEIINRSTRKIHLQTYIFTSDSTGELVIAALKNAASRGVAIYVLADAFGSAGLGRHSISQMEDAGIKFRMFSPLFVHHRLRFGRRLHHKILLADETEALIGGINIEDKYRVEGVKTPWLDYAVYLTGPVCQYISHVCENIWQGKFYKARKKRRRLKRLINDSNHPHSGLDVRILQNDWLYKKDGISRNYRHALKSAHSSIVILCSYFLPGRRIRNLLLKAAAGNVRVSLILQGASDVTLVKKATTWLYAWMLRNNFEIYEWDKSVLHGKMTCVDNSWITIGSYNVNHLSDYGSIETNVASHASVLCDAVREELLRVKDSSKRVTYSEYHNKMNVFEQFSCWLSFHVIRLLFKLQYALLSRE